MSTQSPIKPTEMLLRVFQRVVGDEDQAAVLLPEDFVRRRGVESGISLWRLSHISMIEAIGKLKGKKMKGAAVCRAALLTKQGLTLITPADGAHVSLYCKMCNRKPSPDCAPTSNSNCPLFGGIETLPAWCAETFTVLEKAKVWKVEKDVL